MATERKLKEKSRLNMASCRDEIVIYAKNIERAQAAFSLILDAWTVITGELPWKDELLLTPVDKTERAKLQIKDPLSSQCCWSTSGFLFSCLLGQKASANHKFLYAIALFRQSIALHSNYDVDLNPGLFPYQHRSLCPRDHIRYAYAIICAYAVLEQLGLALHGECFKEGKWIEVKRVELELRLKNAGIDLSDSLLWQVRGGRTKLELKRPPTVLRKCSWSWGVIRDCEVNFVDAIADLRWLRSRVAAHDVDSWVSLLSVHDVSNAQALAQRSILESMGFNQKSVRKHYHEYGLNKKYLNPPSSLR